MRRLALALLTAAALVAACVDEGDDPLDADDTTTTETPDTTAADGDLTPDPIEWDDCGAVECATLDVPLDYEDPEGEQIELYVARAPATGERLGALFINPGGPGAGAAEYADYAFAFPEAVTEHFDIVGVDPRGVGGSTPLDCGVDPVELYSIDASIDSLEDEAVVLETSEAFAAACGEEHGDVLAFMGSREVARDMDAVRAAMGDEQLSYLGYSYGTVIGQVYADLFPDRVRSMVLDAVVELGPTGLELADEQAAGFESALQAFAEFCDQDGGCALGGRTLEAVDQVLAMAERPGGIPAPDADRPAGPGEANLGISYPLYSQSLWSQLDDALESAVEGDGSELVELADAYLDIGAFEVYFAVNCVDFAWPTGDHEAFFAAAKDAAERSPHFGEILVNDYVRCADWPTSPVPLTPVTAPGTPPILVVSTTGDPATPYEAGVAVAERLESGILITNEGEGHGVVFFEGEDCIDDLVVDYLVDGDVPEDGTTCE